MPEYEVIGLFHDPAPAADVLEQLRGLGIPDEKTTVMSHIPYKPGMLGIRPARKRLGRAALLGAILGIGLATFLSVGIFLLYPLIQGNQGIVPVPPTLIVYFEVTMLGTMWVTFFGFLLVNRLPRFRTHLYDPHITEGHIGVVAQVDESLVGRVEEILKTNAAHHTNRAAAVPATDPWNTRFWLIVAGLIVAATIITVLFVYDIVRIPFPTNMADQPSIAYEQGPRLAAPAAAIPVQGPVLIVDQPATEPVAATPASLQRGQVLFGINCLVCHGQTGVGNGTLSGFFNPKPFDLTSAAVQNLSDAEIFLVITQGRGAMPSLAENLSPVERWDVVNYVRSLKK